MFKFLSAAVAMFFAVGAFAEDPKIAVIDMEEVFNSYYKTKVSAANLKKQAEVFKAYAQKLTESGQKLMDEFKTLRDESQNIAISKTEQENKRIQAQEKYRLCKEKEAELTQYNKTKLKQLNQERAQMRDTLLKEIKDEINKRAALAGYILVIDRSGNTMNNIPVVIYSSPSIDITDSIVKELNRGFSSKDAGKDEKLDKDMKNITDVIKDSNAAVVVPKDAAPAPAAVYKEKAPAEKK